MKKKSQKLRIWWVPQIPMSAFRVDVDSPREGKKLLDILAKYDLFQLRNNIKPDYSNAGGLEVYENGEWLDWENADGQNIDEVQFSGV